MKPLNARQRMAERARGAKWFHGLSRSDKGELGDAFVLGTFDWRDWLHAKPSGAFLSGAEDERLHWECTQ